MSVGDGVKALELDGEDSSAIVQLPDMPLSLTSEESVCLFHYPTLCRCRMGSCS